MVFLWHYMSMNSHLAQKPVTEQPNAGSAGLDTKEPADILAALLRGQSAAADTVVGAIPSMQLAAIEMAKAIATGSKLAYVGAGSSGLMAMADALELPGTFGIPRGQIKILLAGGICSLDDLAGAHEDNDNVAEADVASADLDNGDCALCVSASGSTPYTVSAARRLLQRGGTIIALVNNAQAPLLEYATIPIVLDTPPELISGSTRMGAGTAQKIALNMISTLMAIHLGHVHDGLMVNLVADNIKLRRRASEIVSTIAGCEPEHSLRFLEVAGGSVKVAVLLASGVPGASVARELLSDSGGNLRAAMGANQ